MDYQMHKYQFAVTYKDKKHVQIKIYMHSKNL